MVVNGDFETGDFTGWTLVGDPDYNVVASDDPHGGSSSAFFGQANAAATLSQDLATIVGHEYSVSFWLLNEGGSVANASTTNSFAMRVGGATLLSVQDKNATDYTLFKQVFTASSTITSLAFSFQHDEAFWQLDDVAVSDVTSPTSNVPEPSSMWMLVLGLGALALRLRRLR